VLQQYFNKFAMIGIPREAIRQLCFAEENDPRYVCYMRGPQQLAVIFQTDASQNQVLSSPMILYNGTVQVSQLYYQKAFNALQQLRQFILSGVNLVCMGMGHAASVAQIFTLMVQTEIRVPTRCYALGPVPCFGIQTATAMQANPSFVTIVQGFDYLTRLSNHASRVLHARCGNFETGQAQLQTEMLSTANAQPDSMFIGGNIIWLVGDGRTFVVGGHHLGEMPLNQTPQIDYTAILLGM